MPNGEEQQAADRNTNPVGWLFENRWALKKLPAHKADQLMNVYFSRYMLPRYQQTNPQGLSREEIDGLKLAFKARMLDVPTGKQVKVKDPEPREVTRGEAGRAAVESIAAGTLGGVRKLSELVAKLDKSDLSKDPIHQAISSAESKLYEDAQSLQPAWAKAGAAFGHQVPATLMASGAGSLVPKVAGGAAAPLGMRMAEAGARGAVEMPAYQVGMGEKPTPGMAAFGGGVGAAGPLVWQGLKRAFPSLERWFGERPPVPAGQQPSAQAPTTGVPPPPTPGAPPTTPTPSPAGAPTPSAKPGRSRMGDVVEQVAQSNFGKPFTKLNDQEKAQLEPLVRKHLADEQAAKATAKKQKSDMLKSAKKAVADTEAEKASKEAAAKQAAEKQAQSRAAGETQQQAVAAKAAQENPTIAKVMTPPVPKEEKPYTGEEHRKTAGVSPTGTERRKTVYEMSKVGTEAREAKEAETKAKEAAVAEQAKTGITHQEVEAYINRNPDLAKKYEAADQKGKDAMLKEHKKDALEQKNIKAGAKEFEKMPKAEQEATATKAIAAADKEDVARKQALELISKDPKRQAAFEKMSKEEQEKVIAKYKEVAAKTTKVPEGVSGTPEQKKRIQNRERQAKFREKGKREVTMEAMETMARENVGKYSPEAVHHMQVPELEEAAKSMGGEVVVSGLSELRKSKKLSDTMYREKLLDWVKERMENIGKEAAEAPKEGL